MTFIDSSSSTRLFHWRSHNARSSQGLEKRCAFIVLSAIAIAASITTPASAQAESTECSSSARETLLWADVGQGVDDGSTPFVLPTSIFPHGLLFGDETYETCFINSNGNISFGRENSAFTAGAFPGLLIPIIAPFYADADLRDRILPLQIQDNPGQVVACEDDTEQSISIAWIDIHHYDVDLLIDLTDVTRTNTFQVIMANNSQYCDDNVFHLIIDTNFRYEQLEWYVGRRNGGLLDGRCADDPAGCQPAMAGFDMGDGSSAVTLDGSGEETVAADLLQGSNWGVPGSYWIRMVDGDPSRCGNGAVDACETCDDGNQQSGDGCSSLCLSEGSDADNDHDGVIDRQDDCPFVADPAQVDSDGDGIGDACEEGATVNTTFGLAGGGCSLGATGGTGGYSLALAIVLYLGWWRRRSRHPSSARPQLRRIAALVAPATLLPILASSPAFAQDMSTEFSVERFRLASDGDGILNVEWADVPGHLSWDMALWFGASDDPLVVYTEMDGNRERVGAVVNHRIMGTLSGSLALWSHLQLGLELPFVMAQDQDELPVQMDIGNAGLGDARISPKIQLLDARRHGIHLAFIPAVTVPMGSSQGFRNDTGAVFAPGLAGSRSIGGWRLSGNLGYRLRNNVQSADLNVEDELTAELGAGYRFAAAGGPPLEVDLSLAAATAATAPFERFNSNYLEFIGGLAYDFAGPLRGLAAGGVGVNEGFGTPDWRIVFGLRLAGRPDAPEDKNAGSSQLNVEARDIDRDSDSDGDGLLDSRDGCPTQPETFNGYGDEDGCPDVVPDFDGDGILGAADRCADAPEDFDGYRDEDGCPDVDNDGDGVLDSADKCPDQAGPVENRGCPDADRDRDTVIDRLDNCPDEPGSPENFGCRVKQLVQLERTRIRILDAVYFATDRAVIRRRSYPLLQNVAHVLRAHPEIDMIRIEGHTDSRASDDYNLDLSQRRAEAVVEFLIAEGIARSRLIARGYGETQPVDSNATRDGRAANRRVEFNIVTPAGE